MTKPTTTEGNARKVLSRVSTKPLPVNFETPKKAPNAMPKTHAIKQAVALTPKDLPAMAKRPASKEVIN